MNIQKNRLTLSKESVRVLNTEALKYVRGGDSADTFDTIQPDSGTTSACRPVGTE